jgi:hypothetical protein
VRALPAVELKSKFSNAGCANGARRPVVDVSRVRFRHVSTRGRNFCVINHL